MNGPAVIILLGIVVIPLIALIALIDLYPRQPRPRRVRGFDEAHRYQLARDAVRRQLENDPGRIRLGHHDHGSNR